jgi:flagellin-like protein
MSKPRKDSAVSPVVGVLLMLVVTIIIAAVVSGFAGGLAGGAKKAPDASFDVKISNSGIWGGSQFQINVLGVSEPISTKDLKIITSWSKNGISNGATIVPWAGDENTNVHYKTTGFVAGDGYYQAPLGYGAGVEDWVSSGTFKQDQFFGNYTITSGTSMKSGAYGYTSAYGGYGMTNRYEYASGSTYVVGTSIDGMQAVLGANWNILRPGDKVRVSIIYTPTGTALFDRDVQVAG